jgi:hypothetical protein
VHTPLWGDHMFLGWAFFDPSLAGVKPQYHNFAQMAMLIHEAVHLLGSDFGDSKFGGSKALTNLIVDKCFTVLRGNLGGLVQ